MSTITSAQNRAIHAIINKLGWGDNLVDLVRSYGDGSGSMRAMTVEQAGGLLKYLKAQQDAMEQKASAQRTTVYKLMRQLGWVKAEGLDFALLTAFIMSKGVVKKDIRKQNSEELGRTLGQLRGVLENNKNAEPGRAVRELRRELGV